jgi:ribose 5-phosphate isomerase B
MDYISETEIRNIVKKVLDTTVPGLKPADAISSSLSAVEQPCDTSSKKIVAIGCDHGGYEMKTILIQYLKELGHTVIDCGTNSKESVDYPDFALAVAEKVHSREACCGIVIDAAGIGSCITANKVPGVRAAMCYDFATANNSREHNDANVLSLGAGLLGINQVKLITKTWLEVPFAGGRHARRVDKITEIEKRFSKEG